MQRNIGSGHTLLAFLFLEGFHRIKCTQHQDAGRAARRDGNKAAVRLARESVLRFAIYSSCSPQILQSRVPTTRVSSYTAGEASTLALSRDILNNSVPSFPSNI